jgi:hypothetical protein
MFLSLIPIPPPVRLDANNARMVKVVVRDVTISATLLSAITGSLCEPGLMSDGQTALLGHAASAADLSRIGLASIPLLLTPLRILLSLHPLFATRIADNGSLARALEKGIGKVLAACLGWVRWIRMAQSGVAPVEVSGDEIAPVVRTLFEQLNAALTPVPGIQRISVTSMWRC